MGKRDLQHSQLIWNLLFSGKERVPILFFPGWLYVGYKFYFLFVI